MIQKSLILTFLATFASADEISHERRGTEGKTNGNHTLAVPSDLAESSLDLDPIQTEARAIQRDARLAMGREILET